MACKPKNQVNQPHLKIKVNNMENQDPVIFSAVRSVLPFIAGAVAQAGIMTQDQAMTVGGGIIAIASVVWAIYANRKRNTVSK